MVLIELIVLCFECSKLWIVATAIGVNLLTSNLALFDLLISLLLKSNFLKTYLLTPIVLKIFYIIFFWPQNVCFNQNNSRPTMFKNIKPWKHHCSFFIQPLHEIFDVLFNHITYKFKSTTTFDLPYDFLLTSCGPFFG